MERLLIIYAAYHPYGLSVPGDKINVLSLGMMTRGFLCLKYFLVNTV